MMGRGRYDRAFAFTCPSCGKTMFADELSRGGIHGCPYCGGKVAIPQDAPHDCVPPGAEVRVAAEGEGLRRLFAAAPWQIRECVLWMALGGIVTWPSAYCGEPWELPLAVLVGLPFSLLFAWMLLKWNWFRWTSIVCGYGGNVLYLMATIFGVCKLGWGPCDLAAAIMSAIMGIFMASQLLTRPCAAWYHDPYVGVMQQPLGKRRSILLRIMAYIVFAILAQLRYGPVWFHLDNRIDDKTCPIVVSTPQTLNNGPQIGKAYLFKNFFPEGGSTLAMWKAESVNSYSRIYWRTGTVAKFRHTGRSTEVFNAFLCTRRDFKHGILPISGIYVCCGTVEADGERYIALREMDGKIARRRLAEHEEAVRKAKEAEKKAREIAEKTRLLEQIRTVGKEVEVRTINVNRILTGEVHEGFAAKEALKADPSIDVKLEREVKGRALSTDDTINVIEKERMRLDGELARLDGKLKRLVRCYETHRRQMAEEEEEAAKRHAELAAAAARRRAEAEARELESRKVKCQPCGGTGSVVCARCKGNGATVSYEREQCPSCGNNERRGYVKHRVRCDRCGGRGQIVARCSTCGGRGRVRGSETDAFGRRRLDTRETCSSCGGSGRGVPEPCPKCFGGTGEVDAWQPCGRCRGTGVVSHGIKGNCPSCDGRGKLKCDCCEGRGFTYRPK